MFFSGASAVLWAQQPQSIEITGVIVDESGPLPGANISVKDVPGLGSSSDINGKYKIKVAKYQTLVFSYVGYETQEIPIIDQREINVTMKESESNVIDEVVITATGAQRKLTVTGAITTVEIGELKSNPSSSISNALAGNVAGVMAWTTSGQPGKNISEFWIRGISTFGAGTSAYVLVDGFERDLNDLNIEDIEAISVLKDASATAIYGSKGANGVVLVTTKRGKDSKITITAKGETTYNTRTRTPEFVDGLTYANLLNEARITRNQEPMYQPEELEILRRDLDPDLYPNVDWMDMLLKEGAMSYRFNLNLSGGGNITRYFVSGSYVEEQGMYNSDTSLREDYDTNANYKRWNYRMNADINVTKTTLVKVGISGSLAKRNSPGLGDADLWGEMFGYSAIRTPVLYSNGYVPAVGTGNQTNPWVAATQTGFNENWTNKIQTNISLEQDLDFITKGLKFTGRFGYDTNNENAIQRRKWPEQYRAERARDINGNLVFTKIANASTMFQNSSSSGNRREFFDLVLNWNRKLFGEHNFGATAKYTRDSFIKTQGLGTDLKNGVSERNQGLAGRVTYNWHHRYFVDYNFGYTGSENFATGHQYGFFPAYSFAWNLSEEPFIKNNAEWIGLFKIRYSHGKVGNDDMGDERFPYLYTISDTNNDASTVAGYNWGGIGSARNFNGMRYTDVASPYVTWEVATKNDLGLDISLFKDKFNLNADYFDEKREGIYMARAYLPQMVGLESNPKANVGAVRSKGVDGRFAVKHQMRRVHLTVRGNMTYSENEILERDEENNVYPYQMEKGYRVNQNKGLIALGLFKDYDDIRNSPKQTFGTYQPGDIKYKDVNGDGVVDAGDVVAVGATKKPNMIYGLGASVVWKGLDVSVHFQGAGKSDFFIFGKCIYAFSENLWGNIMKNTAENRWISADLSGDPATEDPNASYPRLSFGGNANNFRNSTYWLRNGAYLRLKTVDIGYSFPKKFVNKIRCNNVRLFMIGTNLLTWSDFKLWDPEMGANRGEQYPLAKSVTFGLNFNF
ncbi:MAG: TonB-dependent receptor [Bacteroidales bacterium]|jgi:TonB-linked SusC/RagA family outer membrane protein|nr:TonB-dependent receptor [Bacteroidales bacterium]